jgi:Conserved domain frequently associated with peptide methionine sulfoxide reductase
MSNNQNHEIDEEVLKNRLTPIAYAVLRNGATEPPFSGAYNQHFNTGDYHCLVCDNLLLKYP